MEKKTDIDQAWDILRSICHATNNDDWDKVVELFYTHRESLRSEHFDALAIGITLIKDFVIKYKTFVSDLISDVKMKNITFDSIRTAYRFAVLEVLFEEPTTTTP